MKMTDIGIDFTRGVDLQPGEEEGKMIRQSDDRYSLYHA